MEIPLRRVLVPTDFSEKARMALLYGVALAERFSAHLHVLHVVEAVVDVAPLPQDIGARDQLESVIVEGAWNELNNLIPADDRKRLKVEFAVEWGVPFAEIIRYAQARQIDLIAMGTHGKGGVQQLLLGSVAENVVRGAPCAVLTVRDPPESGRALSEP